MKLAEALIVRADLQKKMEQLRPRLTRSAKVQEGEKPPENPQDLIKELENLSAQLEELIRRINKTNAVTMCENDMSLTAALAKRDVLGVKRSLYHSLVEAAAAQQNRYSGSEIKIESTVKVAKIQKQVDDLSRQYRELDTQIQQVNWNTHLLEDQNLQFGSHLKKASINLDRGQTVTQWWRWGNAQRFDPSLYNLCPAMSRVIVIVTVITIC